MRVVVAPDKFKGSLTALQVGAALERGIHAALPDAHVDVIPMADGGEGTLDAALAAGYARVDVTATGPLGEPVQAGVGLLDEQAVVEMASASGLDLVPEDRRDAVRASSRGTGELILAAVEAGARRVVLAIGGSASTDGGAGMLAALGVRLLDATGREVQDGGAGLNSLARVDLSGLDRRILETEFILASDVDNPLLGERGAASVFGPQKGATADQVVELENGLRVFSRLLPEGTSWARRPGAGAAGGVGFAAMAVLGAVRRAGVEVVADLTGLAKAVHGAGLVITGEGSFDRQSLGGKTPMGVAAIAAAQAPEAHLVMVCGRSQLGESVWREVGFAACLAVADRAPDLESSMRETSAYLERMGEEIASSCDV